MGTEKRALIVGSGGRRDIVFAQAFLDDGISVELLVHGNGNLPDVITQAPVTAVDFTDEDKIHQAVRSFADKRGRIDYLITCPDFRLNRSLVEITEKEWDESVSMNLTSVFMVCKQVVPFMILQRAGRIINLSSDAGRMGAINGTAYAAAKAGVMTFSKALAREVAPYGIRVNVVSLGMIEEEGLFFGGERGLDSVPLKRPGNWEEVAFMLLCLLNDRTNYLTGQTIHVNGGLYMP